MDIDMVQPGIAADADAVGCAERDVGRYIYERIEALMDATEGPRAAELSYLAEIVAQVEEYGVENCVCGIDAWPERLS